MKKLFSAFMAMLVTVSSISISIKGMDFTESDREETSVRQERFERDLPRGGINKLEIYSDGTKILYVSAEQFERVRGAYYEKYLEGERKKDSSSLSDLKLFGYLFTTGAILVVGTVATVYTCAKLKEADEKIALSTSSILQGLGTLALSFFTAKPVYGHFTRKSYENPVAEEINRDLREYLGVNGAPYGVAIIEMPQKTAELISRTFYTNVRTDKFYTNEFGIPYCTGKGGYAIFHQKINQSSDVDLRRNFQYFKQCLKKLGINRIEYTEDTMECMRIRAIYPFASPYTRPNDGKTWWRDHQNKECYK